MKKYALDIVVVLLIFIISLIMMCYASSNQSTDLPSRVNVYVNGTIFGTYPLNVDNKIDIDNDFGHNTIIIKDGSVYMSESDCDNSSCVRMGKISENNESIICIPHRIVIELKNDEGIIDAIAY